MGNLDFCGHALFSWYVVLLILSGIAMIGLAGLAARPLSKVLNLLFGFGFVVYGVYLGWVWHGGTYLIFFKAFLLPLLLAVSTVRGGLAKRGARRSSVVVQVPETLKSGEAD